jgi:hypothetical protein
MKEHLLEICFAKNIRNQGKKDLKEDKGMINKTKVALMEENVGKY